MFFGTNSGYSEINKLAVSTEGYIAFGGRSFDLTFVAQHGNLFYGVLDDSGTHILWARELSSSSPHEIKELKFTPDSSNLVILLTNVRVTLFIHEALTGTLITGLADSSSQLT
jgi:hypothetical protein